MDVVLIHYLPTLDFYSNIADFLLSLYREMECMYSASSMFLTLWLIATLSYLFRLARVMRSIFYSC